jgi:hypothetical protein
VFADKKSMCQTTRDHYLHSQTVGYGNIPSSMTRRKTIASTRNPGLWVNNPKQFFKNQQSIALEIKHLFLFIERGYCWLLPLCFSKLLSAVILKYFILDIY